MRSTTALLCTVAIAAMTNAAIARPAHKHHKQHHPRAAAAAPAQQTAASGSSTLYSFMRADWERMHKHPRVAKVRRAHRRGAASAAPAARSFTGGFTTNELVATARKYIGTNPTNRRSLWCGAFMDMVLKQTGHKGGGNLARGYSRYGHRIPGPRIGAIAVMGRRGGGGHVGVVSGIDQNGNPIIVSGNHNRTVAESVYPRGRIYAYVMPNN